MSPRSAVRWGLLGAAALLGPLAAVPRRAGAETAPAESTPRARALAATAAGRHAEAAKILEEVLAERRSATPRDELAVALAEHDLGTAQLATGQEDAALELLQASLQHREAALGPAHPEVADTLNNLAVLHRNRGDLRRARAELERALRISEATLGEEDPAVATTLNDLGVVLLELGELVQAEERLEAAAALKRAAFGPDALELATVLGNLGALHLERGDVAGAEELGRQELAILERRLGQQHPRVAEALGNLAVVSTRSGQLGEAEFFRRRVLAILERSLGAAHPATARARAELGGLLLGRGEQEPARELLESALAAQERAGKAHPDLGRTRRLLASLALRELDLDRAEALLVQSRNAFAASLPADHPETVATQQSLALLAALRGDPARSLERFAEVIEQRERYLSRVLASGTERERAALTSEVAGDLDLATSLHLRVAPDLAAAQDLAFTTVLRRKGRVLGVTSELLAAVHRRNTAADRATLRALGAVQGELARRAIAGDESNLAAQAELEREARALEDRLAEAGAKLLGDVKPVTLAAVQGALPAGSALLEIVRFVPLAPSADRSRWVRETPRYAAYLLRADGARASADLGEQASLDALIGRTRGAMADPTRDPSADSAELYRRVLGPFAEHLEAVRHLFVAPDGALNLIPLDGLLDGSGQPLLVKRSVTYLTTGRTLLTVDESLPAQSDPLVVASPDFGPAPGGKPSSPNRAADLAHVSFGSLPGTQQEGEQIQELLPLADLIFGESATERALKNARGPQILHVATHGFFLGDVARSARGATRALELELVSEDVPAATAPAAPPSSLGAAADPLLRSGLALTGANVRRGERGDDGILTALEATTLDLTGTKLVVLSACETGLGDVSNGEGVYGLRRALAEAGAETLVMSLWKVDDAATRALMVRYYEKLRAGEGRTEALRHARLSLLAEPATRHPFYWSGFVVSGDWRPIDWEGKFVTHGEAIAPPITRGASPTCACQLPGAPAGDGGGWVTSLLLGLGVGTRRHGNGWKRPRHEKERSG